MAVFYEKDLTIEEATAVLSNEASAFLSIEGIDVHYRREGQGFPIVLLHGTGAMLQTWDVWTDSLVANGYEVVRMDLPGFGLTGPTTDDIYTITKYTTLLDSFVERLGVDSFHIAGNSLGGNIAWEYALDHQQKLGKMILLDPSGFSAPQSRNALAFRIAELGPLAYTLTKVGTSSMVRKTLTDVYADDSKVTEELVALYLTASRRPGNRDAFVARLQQENVDRTSGLSTLQTPTLLMWGEEDQLIPAEIAANFQESLPNDTLILYPAVGHMPMEEAPAKSVTDALQFLQNVPATTPILTNTTIESQAL